MRVTAKTILVAMTVALFGCDQDEEPVGKGAGHDPRAAPVVRAVRIEAATIQPSSFSIQLARPGEVEPAREAAIAAALGGQIEKVNVSVGDQVDAGQVLAKVDASLYGAQVSLARVEVDEAKRELDRLRTMGGTVPRVRLDAAETRVEREQAKLRISKIRASRSTLKSPFAGVVAECEIEPGEVAPPGAALVKIVSLDPARVSVSVADRDVGGLEVGSSAAVTAAGASAPVAGTISRIEPMADIKTRSFMVEVEVSNPEGKLRPGMIANVVFHGGINQERIVLPQEFLVTKRDSNGVFVVGEGDVAEWRSLTLGVLVRDQIVIDDGLQAGEKVVVLGQRALSEGDPLIVSRLGSCCEAGRVRFPGVGQPDVVAAAGEGDR